MGRNRGDAVSIEAEAWHQGPLMDPVLYEILRESDERSKRWSMPDVLVYFFEVHDCTQSCPISGRRAARLRRTIFPRPYGLFSEEYLNDIALLLAQ